MERSLLIIKPNAHWATSLIIEDLRSQGFVYDRCIQGSYHIGQWKHHYKEHQEKDFFEDLCSEMADKPVTVMIIEGQNVISDLRQFVGVTNPAKAQRGSLRRRYGETIRHNAVHASSSVEDSQYEISIWFPDETS
jgi:nucleoside-diphosphate kinase